MIKPLKKSERMKRGLISRIRSGEFSAEERLAPIGDLAKEYGISYVTAHKVLGELEKEGFLTCRNGVGVFVRRLENQIEIRKLAVPLRLQNNPVFAPFFEEIAHFASRENIPVMFGASSESEPEFIEEAIAAGCNAMLRFPGPARMEHGIYELLRKHSLRTVILNDWWQEGAGEFPCVRSDEGRGITTILEHLYKLGHRKIALVQEAVFAERCELSKAFHRWHHRYGLAVTHDALIYTADFKNKLDLIQHLVDGGFSAVFFSFDLVALRLIESAADSGRDLRKMFCIAAFDDIPESASWGLTTVRHNIPVLVREAFRLLRSPDYDKHEVCVIPGECVFRASTSRHPEVSSP